MPWHDREVSRILAVAPVLAPHRYEQADLTAMFADLVGLAPERRDLLDRLHGSCAVSAPLPGAADRGLQGPGRLRRRQRRVHRGRAGAGRARPSATALDRGRAAPADVDLILTTSVTGIAAPSLDARLVPAARACGRTSSGSRSSGWGASRAPPASPGCTTTWSATRATSRCCCRSSSARSPSSATTTRWPTWWAAACSATARPPSSWPATTCPLPPALAAQRAAGRRHPQPVLRRHRAGHGLGHRRLRASGSCSPPAWPTSSATTCPAEVDDFLASHGAGPRRRRVAGWPTRADPGSWRRCRRRSTCRPARSSTRGGRSPTSATCRPRRCCTCWPRRWPRTRRAAGTR